MVGIAILASLGVWQLKRLAWKEALIAEVGRARSRALADPPAPEAWAGLKPSDYEYRHVRVSGVYDLKRQALVFRALSSPKGRYGGPGYLVMTPLELANGESVLVNRGFVPVELKSAAEQGPAGETVVTGLLRDSESATCSRRPTIPRAANGSPATSRRSPRR